MFSRPEKIIGVRDKRDPDPDPVGEKENRLHGEQVVLSRRQTILISRQGGIQCNNLSISFSSSSTCSQVYLSIILYSVITLQVGRLAVPPALLLFSLVCMTTVTDVSSISSRILTKLLRNLFQISTNLKSLARLWSLNSNMRPKIAAFHSTRVSLHFSNKLNVMVLLLDLMYFLSKIFYCKFCVKLMSA